jgi:hypothetical protein
MDIFLVFLIGLIGVSCSKCIYSYIIGFMTLVLILVVNMIF